jgi:fructose-1,6-bisphosphatase
MLFADLITNEDETETDRQAAYDTLLEAIQDADPINMVVLGKSYTVQNFHVERL